MGSDIYSQLLRCSTARGSSTGLFLVGPTKVQQQYQSFPLSCFGLTGLISGQTEPVLGHKECEIVSLVVNDYYISSS